MEHLNSGTSIPCIVNWIIKYDDIFDMPETLQGACVEIKDGKTVTSKIMIDKVFSLDYTSRIIKSETQTFKLVGPGKRVIFLDEEMVQNISKEINDDFFMDS